MNKYSDTVWWILMLVLTLFGIIIIISGCYTLSPSLPPGAATPQEILTKIVYQTNWLMTLGILACAFGVMSIINGSTKGTQWIGGGLTVVALITTLARWGEWITFALAAIAIGAICLWAYNHIRRSDKIKNLEARIKGIGNLIDVNQDGKINIDDIKIMIEDIK